MKLSYWRMLCYYGFYLSRKPLQNRLVVSQLTLADRETLQAADGVKDLWEKCFVPEINRECRAKVDRIAEVGRVEKAYRMDGQNCLQYGCFTFRVYSALRVWSLKTRPL